MLITVFTPTYNRAVLLRRLYKSLKRQSYKEFEWIIVDDGSTDYTQDIVKDFINEGVLNVIFIRQGNGGKHRAVNKGVSTAKGELFFIVDSDDVLPVNSLEFIAETYRPIRDDYSFGGVSGVDGYLDGRMIGTGLPADFVDCNSIDIRYKYHVKGDMAEVFRTSVMREFPFPEIESEKFCPEVLVWNRIAQKYRLRYFNKIIYMAEYQTEGLTSKITQIRMKSPVASMMCYAEMNALNIPYKDKMRAAINYWRFRLCSNDTHKLPTIPFVWFWTVFIGGLMHINDLKYNKR